MWLSTITFSVKYEPLSGQAVTDVTHLLLFLFRESKTVNKFIAGFLGFCKGPGDTLVTDAL